MSVGLHHESTCLLSRAVDGCIQRRGTISSCQSAATSKIVKRCCSRVFSYKQHYRYTLTVISLPLPLLSALLSQPDDQLIPPSPVCVFFSNLTGDYHHHHHARFALPVASSQPMVLNYADKVTSREPGSFI